MTTPVSYRRFLMLWLLLLLTNGLLMLAGCGGGSPVSKKTGKGAAVFTIKWPPQTKSVRLISSASNLIRIQISAQPNGGGASYGFQDAVRPHVDGQPDLTTPTTTLTFNNLPPGAYYATANGYPGYQSDMRTPAAPAQTTATVPLTIADGQTTTSNLTMASTITRLQLSTDRLVIPQSQTQFISVMAFDGNNAQVMTAPSTFQWTVSNTAIASLVMPLNNGEVVSGVTRGVTQISVTDTESGKSVSANVLVPGLALSAWPKFHQNGLNQGVSAATPGTVGAVKWSAQAGAAVRSSPAIGVDGTVYVGSDIKNMYAFNGATGALKWAFATDGLISSSPTVGADGTIYVATENGTVYALADNGTSATQKWAYALGDPFLFSSPAIGRDGTIYIGSANGNVYAITDNGISYTRKWMYSITTNFQFNSTSIRSCPAISADGTIYIIGYVNANGTYAELFALSDNTNTAMTKWRYAIATTAGNSSPAVGSDGTIYAGLGINLYAFTDNGTSYTLKWQSGTSGIITSSPAVGPNGTVYVGSDDGALNAFQSSDGTSKWVANLGGSVTCSPAAGEDGTIYVGTKNAGSNKVYALTDAGTSATQKWAFSTGAVKSSPAIGADGTVFIGSDDQQIYAIK